MTISILPSVPSRADPTNFAARADALLGALPAFVSEANALEANVNAKEAGAAASASAANASAVSAASASAMALAAANYKGLWTALSGALSVPASTYHLGRYWVLASNIADVTAKVPGTATEWLKATVPSSTATPSGAANVVLTNTSADIQVVTPSAPGVSVIAPDATTLVVQKDLYTIVNAGAYVIGFRNAAGTLLRTILPGGTARIGCFNNATLAGGWAIDGSNLGHVLPRREISQVSATPNAASTNGGNSTLKLSDSLVVYVARNGTTLYLTAHDLASDTLGATVPVAGMLAMEAATYATGAASGVIFQSNENADYYALAFTLSGLAISVGSVTTKTFTGGTVSGGPNRSNLQAVIAQLGSGTFVLPGKANTATPYQPAAVACTVSGTAITFGAVTNIGATIVNNYPEPIECIGRSATQAVLLWTDTTGSLLHARHVSVSGTAITVDSSASGAAGAQMNAGNMTNVVAMATDEWWIVWGSSTTARVLRVTVSGTTVAVVSAALTALGSFSLLDSTGRVGNSKPLVRVSATVAVLTIAYSSTVWRMYKISYAGGFTDVLYQSSGTSGFRGKIDQPTLAPAYVVGNQTHALVSVAAAAPTTDASHCALVVIDPVTTLMVADVRIQNGRGLYCIFKGGKLYVMAAYAGYDEIVCVDLATGNELSRQTLKKIIGATSQMPYMPLCGSVVCLSGVSSDPALIGQYITTAELAA